MLPRALTRDRNLRLGKLLWDSDFEIFLDYVSDTRPAANTDDLESTQPTRNRESRTPEPAATVRHLLAAAARLYVRIDRALSRVGLNCAEYDVLDQLRCAREPLDFRVFDEKRGCADGRSAPLLSRLQAHGLVRGVYDPGQPHRLLVELTPEGAMLVQEGDTQVDVVDAQFAAAFTAEERLELERLLARIK